MILFTNGCFDVLHAGHLQMLQYGRWLARGDAFYVGIDSDARVQALKGPLRPYYTERERISMLMHLTCNGMHRKGCLNSFLIDWVDAFDDDDGLYQLIKRIKPDYILKGDEWMGKKVIGDDIAPVLFYPAFFKQRCSTSEIERRILQKNCIYGSQTNTPKTPPQSKTESFAKRLMYRRRNQ